MVRIGVLTQAASCHFIFMCNSLSDFYLEKNCYSIYSMSRNVVTHIHPGLAHQVSLFSQRVSVHLPPLDVVLSVGFQ